MRFPFHGAKHKVGQCSSVFRVKTSKEIVIEQIETIVFESFGFEVG